MAEISVTVTLSDAQQAIVQRVRSTVTGGPVSALKATQFLLDGAITQYGLKFSDSDRTTMREAFDKATTQEQATITTILDQYR